MGTTTRFTSVDDATLLAQLSELIAKGRSADAQVVAHIAEVDMRKLFLPLGYSSMFAYCTERLHLSEHATYLRIRTARVSRRFPVLLDMLADGRLHLTAVGVLSNVLLADTTTSRDAEQLIAGAVHRSKRQVLELIATFAPVPDAPSSLRKLPTRPQERTQVGENRLGPDQVALPALAQAERTRAATNPAAFPPPAPTPRPAAAFTPTAEARYKVQFTASKQLRDKLDRLRALSRTHVPNGDLAAVVELAVDAYLAKVEAKRFGKTDNPRTTAASTDTTPRSRHIPASVRRAVAERDGNRCTFVGTDGHRCSATDDLQFDHLRAYAKGGTHSAENLALRCRAHNAYRAVLEFGDRRTSSARESTHGWQERVGLIPGKRARSPRWRSEADGNGSDSPLTKAMAKHSRTSGRIPGPFVHTSEPGVPSTPRPAISPSVPTVDSGPMLEGSRAPKPRHGSFVLVGICAFALAWTGCGKRHRDRHRARVAQIYDSARSFFMDRADQGAGLFPAESVGPTPVLGACCEHKDKRCRPDPALWEHATWRALSFSVDEADSYSYEYTVGPDSAKGPYIARAYGDLDCDGVFQVFEMWGMIHTKFHARETPRARVTNKLLAERVVVMDQSGQPLFHADKDADARTIAWHPISVAGSRLDLRVEAAGEPASRLLARVRVDLGAPSTPSTQTTQKPAIRLGLVFTDDGIPVVFAEDVATGRLLNVEQ